MTKSDDSPRKIAGIPPFGLRMQPELKRRLETVARQNARSMNAEIIARLEASFAEGWLERAQQSPLIRLEKRLAGIEAKLENRIDELEQRLAAAEAKLQ